MPFTSMNVLLGVFSKDFSIRLSNDSGNGYKSGRFDYQSRR